MAVEAPVKVDDSAIKKKKISIVKTLLFAIQSAKVSGELKDMMNSVVDVFARELLQIINSKLGSADPQKRTLLGQQRRRVIEANTLMKQYLVAQTSQQLENYYSKMIEQLSELLRLIEAE